MAVDKDPSIFSDRSAIGTTDELDEYGVWVKSEPQDLSSTGSFVADLEESGLPSIEDLPDIDADSSFDLPSIDGEPASVAAARGDEAGPMIQEPAGLPSFEDDFDLPSMDLPSMDLPSMDEPSPGLPGSEIAEDEHQQARAPGPERAEADESFTELSMDDFLEPESPAADSGPVENDEPFDISLEFNDEESPEALEIPEAASGGFDDVEQSVSLETVTDFDDFLNELSESEAPAQGNSGQQQAPAEDDALGIEIAVDESDEMEHPFGAVSDGGDVDFSSPDLELDALADAEIDLSSSGGEAEAFDDVGAVERDLRHEAPRPDDGASTQLLLRIADELASIKSELSSLKDELSTLRGARVVAAEPEPSEPAASAGGFFDEEDDEKIALTGDELDNILNTADFTEESGSDAVHGDGTYPDESLLSDKEDILVEDEPPAAPPAAEEPIAEQVPEIDVSFDEASIDEDLGPDIVTIAETSGVDDAPAIEEIALEDELPATSEIARLQEEGVRPMTSAPEDTSYLDEPELPGDDGLGISLDGIDLTDAVIEEPDLSGIILEEGHIEEPSVDSIHIDLDLEEALHVESVEDEETYEEGIELVLDESSPLEPEPVEEIAQEVDLDEPFDMPVAEESFAEVVPEGFVVEADEEAPDFASVEGIAEMDALESPIGAEPAVEEVEVADEVEEADELAEGLEPVEFGAEIEEPDHGSEPTAAAPIPQALKAEVKTVLAYMDQLLESLPEDKIEEFAKSEYFDTYKKLFEELGLA